ncbi:MAG: hypothetical protein HOH95_07860 [Dehalococcoidia bacterium]|nr:hypothetical protein [Dehalococcoidia bacterium]
MTEDRAHDQPTTNEQRPTNRPAARRQPPATPPPAASEPPPAPSTGEPSPASFDAAATLAHLRRLATLDFEVFEDLRDDRSQTFAGIVVAVVAILLAGIGSWIWVEGQIPFASTGQTLWRLVLVGTLLTTVFWGVWLLVAETMLQKVFGLTTDRWAIVRTAGFAAAPAALMGLVLIQLDAIVFAIALIAIVSWVAISELALRAAVPEARPTQIMRANLAGFFVFAVLVSISAFNWGFAGGPFLFAGGWDNYIGSYGSSDFSAQPADNSSSAADEAVSNFIDTLEEVADALAEVQTVDDAEEIAAETPEILADLTNVGIMLSTFSPEELARATERGEKRFEQVSDRLDAEIQRIQAIEGVAQSSFGLFFGPAFSGLALP